MKADLVELNKSIATNAGMAECDAEKYADDLSICIGRLALSTVELLTLTRGKGGEANPLHIIYQNRDYLMFARMVAMSVIGAGAFEGLIVLGMNIDQARILARLSSAQITHVAKYANGLVYKCLGNSLSVCNFQSSARRQFAAALIAA